MQLTDLGFLFLLLPVAAAAYYCVPNRGKPLALLTVSAFFLLLIDRRTLLLLLLTLLPDRKQVCFQCAFWFNRLDYDKELEKEGKIAVITPDYSRCV